MTENGSAKTSDASNRRPLGWITLIVTAVAVVLDQVTKAWAIQALPEDGSAGGSVGPISLRLLRNPGAAFSFGEGSTWIFTIIATFVVVLILWWVAKGGIKDVWLAVLLGLLAGGAVGNLIDRLSQPPGFARGHVIDFLDYGGLFVGNVADIWIVVGAIGLALYSLLKKDEGSRGGR